MLSACVLSSSTNFKKEDISLIVPRLVAGTDSSS
jgi:hypothetical protein